MARIFSDFQAGDIVSSSKTIVTTGLWTDDTGSLTSFYTSSTQVGSDNFEYYVNVYQANPSVSDSAEVQFSVAYGHVSGGGAATLSNKSDSKLPTKVVYNQYKNILLGDTEGLFSFENGSGTDVSTDHIYVINIQRARLKERLDPGNWQLTLSGSSGSFTFIDDSAQTEYDSPTYTIAGRAFSVASGSLSSNLVLTTTASNGRGFGTVYPDRGIIVLNPDAIVPHCGLSGSISGAGAGIFINPYTSWSSAEVPFAPYTGSLTSPYATQYNHMGLYYSIKKGGSFQARSSETVSSVHLFVRLKNNEFNNSNNPTIRDSDGKISIREFQKKPKTFVTTIGLYNQNNELLAVGKLSRPIEKSSDKEALIKVRLDF
jgi:hypothetical protein